MLKRIVVLLFFVQLSFGQTREEAYNNLFNYSLLELSNRFDSISIERSNFLKSLDEKQRSNYTYWEKINLNAFLIVQHPFYKDEQKRVIKKWFKNWNLNEENLLSISNEIRNDKYISYRDNININTRFNIKQWIWFFFYIEGYNKFFIQCQGKNSCLNWRTNKLFDKVSEIELNNLNDYRSKNKVNVTVTNQVKPSDKLKKYDESSIVNFLDSNNLNVIEGIWIFSNATNGNYARSAIVNGNYNGLGNEEEFFEIHLNDLIRNGTDYKSGDVIASVKKTATEGIYIFREGNITATGIMKSGGIMEVFYPNNKAIVIKEYPSSSKKEVVKNVKGNWAGNGSGVIISELGYIVTNNHVIEDANEIEVEFLLDEEIKSFNAEVVQVDKVNDLAIIKIFDMNFNGVKDIPFNFKTRSSDVGTKVYAFGYPMALSLMGKEIKITDGIISSKSGIDGDITTYQISATIQPGNSGGPLFDDKGNLIGINSSGLARLGSESTGYTIKSSYILNLIDVLPNKIDLPSSNKLKLLPLTEQIKEISKYVVLIKVK